ncbi:AQG_2a_G0018380.mRNA.1.CDS.1 [Saccharomyces cerevisiae]|uniref:Edc1p n=2 Tax=Saccharomyces cerevisiae TaxID=4932 RepID=C7GWX8_YEAS2
MSTDTMYFNSSRLLPSAGRNKTNNLIKQKTRNNRARGNAAKNANNNNYITDIPPPQTLPNGQKPNFGHSSYKKPSFNQKKHSPPSSPSSTTTSGKKNRQNNKETPRQNNKDDTRLLSQNLKNLLLNQKQSPHGSQGIIPMGCNGSAKKLSHSYAGSTFATNGPREAKNLPKPSFL